MRERTISAACVLLFALLCLAWAGEAWAEGGRLTADEIRAGLRVSPQEDQGFVQYVVERTDEGKLPRDVLNASFFWAKRQPRNKFQNFKRAISILAARRGIKL